MLTTILIFGGITAATEFIIFRSLPKHYRTHTVGLTLSVLFGALNLWIGFGTVTGTLTAKLSFLLGLAVKPLSDLADRFSAWRQGAYSWA